jgi:DNA-binding transcriptional regulator YhcF (GntR family)
MGLHRTVNIRYQKPASELGIGVGVMGSGLGRKQTDESSERDMLALQFMIEYANRNHGNTPSILKTARGLGLSKDVVSQVYRNLRRKRFVVKSQDGEWVIAGSVWLKPAVAVLVQDEVAVATITADGLQKPKLLSVNA